MSAVRLTGDALDEASTIRSGVIQFSDGSRVDVGTLEPRGGASTTIAFTPRTTSFVRFQVTTIASAARPMIRRFSVYAVGSLPPAPASPGASFRTTVAAATSCKGVSAAHATRQLRLLCPSNGSRTGSRIHVVVSGPAGAPLRVEAFRPRGSGGAIETVARTTVGRGGTARFTVATRSLLHGPTALRISETRSTTPLYVQLVNDSGVALHVRASAAARGLDLKLNEQFGSPLSVSRTGAEARYASGKPNGYGTDDFGDAIFAQPNSDDANLTTLPGGYLRIRSTGLPAGQRDPAGFGRKAVGGLVSSAHLGGSGFSAQYGYFEVRMLGPAGAGTWPAFWLLSTGSLYRPNTSTAEVDAVELYGAHPEGACQSTHNWVGGKNIRGKAFCGALKGNDDWALRWHTYGAKISPTGTDFYIDGVHTQHTSAMVNNDQSFFFMVNLALGGGWPVDLSGTRSKVDLYVDYVRVWV